MESLLRLGAGVHRRAWTVRSSKSRAARGSVRRRRRDARSPVRASTHGFQQFAGNAIWRREAGTASRSRARRHAVAGVATLSAAYHLSALQSSRAKIDPAIVAVLTVVESHSVLLLREARIDPCASLLVVSRCTGGGLNEHHRAGAVGADNDASVAAQRER